MALHICRDYLVQTASATRSPSSYLLAIFLQRVIGFTLVGQTNFDITSMANTTIAVASNGVALPVATINVASTTGFPSSGNIAVTSSAGVQYITYTGITGTSFTGCSLSLGSGNLSTGGIVSTMLVASGTASPNRAGINSGTGTYHVTIPSAVRTVVAADVGRMIVLKSTANPAFNSGVFVVTAIDTTSGRNDLVINWRSGDSPPVEADNTLNWWLYAADAAAPLVNGTGSASTGYKGSGAATVPRMILQSPHSTAWQLRICLESTTDFAAGNGTVPLVSTTVGFNGNSAGDFLIAGRHCHTALWNDAAAAATKWLGLTPGTADISSNIYRLTIQADDAGQAVVMWARNTSAAQNWIIMLGIPDGEPVPVPTDPLFRLFSLGSRSSIVSDITFANASTGTSNQINAGAAFGSYAVQPISCTTGCWTYSNGPGQTGTPFADATAGDSPFTGSTELLTVDVIAGAFQSYNSAVASNVVPQEPRVMGVVPFLRQGRANFGNFTLSSDGGKAWQHVRNGVYMPWGGPAVLP